MKIAKEDKYVGLSLITAGLVFIAFTADTWWGKILLVLFALGVLYGAWQFTKALTRMVTKSMPVYYLRRFTLAFREWNLHRTQRLPKEFGHPDVGEVVYSFVELQPHTKIPRAIKLGWSENWKGRWKTHRTSSSMEVVVLSVGPGTYAYEQHLLKITRGHWTGGSGTEWRWPTEEVWEVVERMPGVDQALVDEIREAQAQETGVAA